MRIDQPNEPRPPLKKTNREVIRLAGLNLMLVEAEDQSATNSLANGGPLNG